MKVLGVLWFWLTFAGITVVLFCGVLLSRLFTPFLSKQKSSDIAHWFACTWARAIFFANPGWSYSVEGKETLEDKPSVYVGNHQSAGDIIALLAMGTRFRWLSKEAVFKAPLIGPAMTWAGYVPIQRGNPNSHKEAMEKSAERLREGVSMAFFPEGTRSEDGRLKPFKTGAFRLADQENVPIQPLVIQGTKELVRKGSRAPQRSHVRVRILPPTRRHADETLEQFTERVRAEIQRHLDA